LSPNLEVAELLFAFNERRGFKAIEWEFPFIPVGFGAKIKSWHDFYSSPPFGGFWRTSGSCVSRRRHPLGGASEGSQFAL